MGVGDGENSWRRYSRFCMRNQPAIWPWNGRGSFPGVSHTLSRRRRSMRRMKRRRIVDATIFENYSRRRRPTPGAKNSAPREKHPLSQGRLVHAYKRGAASAIVCITPAARHNVVAFTTPFATPHRSFGYAVFGRGERASNFIRP